MDAHGNPMSGDTDTIERYDRAIDRLLRYHPDVVDIATSLLADEEPAPMAAALGAYLNLMSTDPADLAAVRLCHDAIVGHPANEREQLHGRAIGAWQGGDWIEAGDILDEVLYRWPTDLLALIMAHQLAFFVGDAHQLRDRPLRSLHALDPGDAHAGFVRGMVAFGLEESGHYAEALDSGMAAVAANRDDVWAVHAVTHTHEMRGHVDEGIRFLTSGAADWQAGNMFTVHNWWHLGLFQLEAGRPDRVLEIYDREVHHAGSDGIALEMLDASAMLWRLHLDAADAGARFDALSDAWSDKTTASPWYVFNDLHAVIALVGAGRLGEAHAVADRLTAWLPNGIGTNVRMTAEIGLPACRAIIAFGEGRFDDVVEELYPIRRTLQVFGGSHAQRDVLQRTLTEAALRAGRHELARALLAERVGVRETSVYGWTRMAQAMRGLGNDDGATTAEATAERHLTRFRAASA